MSVLQDLLNEELLESDIRIQVNRIYEFQVGDPTEKINGLRRSKTLGEAKSLLEFYDLVRQAIIDYENRAGVSEEHRIIFTEEEPDVGAETETITFGLIRREPGAFGQGAPFEAKVKNLRPILREETSDGTDPGYRTAVLGYWYDNVVRLTCWARTNKAANARVAWLEDMMEDYSWWFTASGVQRVLFWGRNADLVTTIDNNKWYGRPVDYFVRTEKLRTFSEKTIEEIIVKLMTKSE